MKKTMTQNNRRKFLLGAGLGTAGVAAALVARTQTPGKQAEAAPETPQGEGYRATEHVLKYYKTTEV